MNSGTKQRVVGLIVLVALVGVFLPMLFNLEPRPGVDTATQIPERPGIESVEIAEPERVKGVEASPPPQEIFQPREIEEESEQNPAEKGEETAPALSEKGIPESWVLQVGSFKDREGAETLTQRLQDAGYKAFNRAASANGVTVHRVLVGPKIDKQALLSEKTDIDARFGVNTLVLSFEP